jgi:hypothetical protein
MTWGWRSPRRKLKKGNSLIVPGMIRVARHHHQKLEVSVGYQVALSFAEVSSSIPSDW